MSCGTPRATSQTQDSTLKNSENISEYRLIPEYEPSSGVIFNADDVLTRDYRAPKSVAPLLFKERISMYQKIMLHQPNLNYVFLLDPNASKPVKSADTLLSERILSAVLNFGLNVKTFWPSKQDDTLARADEWTRDYAPLWARSKETGEKKPVLYTKRGFAAFKDMFSAANENIFDLSTAADKGIPIQGGNFIVDRMGKCYSTSDTLSALRPQFCAELIQFEALPLEGTTHIDLFAKIVSPSEVIVAQYDDDKIGLKNENDIITYSCSADSVSKKKLG